LIKLLPLIFVSLIWFFIGWFSSGLFQPLSIQLSTLPAEQQRVLKAYQLLESRQLLLHHPATRTPTPARLADAAISGMLVESQDKYADLYGPFATDRYRAGYASAIGMTDLRFDIIDGKRVVTEVPPESAAQVAGVAVGDILLGLDGIDFSHSVGGYEIATLLRGPVGSTYELTFQRGDQILTRTVTRKPWHYLTHQLLRDDIGYLKTEYFFADHTAEAVQAIIDEFTQANIQALIWDLRDNSGGSSAVAETLLSYFREPGALLYTVEFKDGTRRAFTAQGEAAFAAIPIAVLINEETWSAGEIAAAAMAERPFTILIGTTSAGKGVIQDTVELDKSRMLHFTIAKWFTPTGAWLHEVGLAPEIARQDNPLTAQDEVLDAAIDYIDQLLAKE
jgi:carboxyl-terminal processing protease